MRAAFLGTPAAAVPSLAALAAVADVAMVITQPDAPRGRSGATVPSPVKVAAHEWGFTVAQPTDHDSLHRVLADAAVDVAVVVAYGRILRPETLTTARLGFVNVHFSLLPRWRGAAPVERAILAGDERTGVSLMRLDEGMDTGPVLAVLRSDIDPDETGGSLTARLAHDGATLLDDVLPDYMSGRVRPAAQIAAGVTHAARLTTAEAQLTDATPADHALRMIRAYSPRPGAWALIDGIRVKVWNAEMAASGPEVGQIEIIDSVPVLGLAGGAIELRSLQPAGKRALTGAEWANGRRGMPASLEQS